MRRGASAFGGPTNRRASSAGSETVKGEGRSADMLLSRAGGPWGLERRTAAAPGPRLSAGLASRRSGVAILPDPTATCEGLSSKSRSAAPPFHLLPERCVEAISDSFGRKGDLGQLRLAGRPCPVQ